MTFGKYLERRFGLIATHGISPNVMEKLEWGDPMPAFSALNDPKRLAAVRGTGLLDSQPTAGFDRITRLGAAALNVRATFISLVEDHRDFYLSHCGFDEPLASERQVSGQTFCHFTVQGDRPVIIPDTRADPIYANVPTVKSIGVAAYLGVPLVLPSGEVIGALRDRLRSARVERIGRSRRNRSCKPCGLRNRAAPGGVRVSAAAQILTPGA